MGSMQGLIEKYSAEYGVDPALATALAKQESTLSQYDDFGNVLESEAGALGVMQLMPETAAGLGVDPYDLEDNIKGGVKYLAQKLQNFDGNVEMALASYNAGEGAVRQYNGIPPYEETQHYVASILDAYGAVHGDGNTESNLITAESIQADKIFKKFGWAESEIPQQDNPDTQPSTASERFWGGLSDATQSTSATSLGRLLWGNIVHSDSAFGVPYKVTEKDVEFVKEALRGDETAQRFVLMNGRDAESIRWLVKQKQEERQRKERLADYGAGWATVGEIIGGLVDPVNLIPVGTAANALRILKRTGSTITNASKIGRYAAVGAQIAAVNVLDDKLRGSLSGNDVKPMEYAYSAATGFLAGSVLTALGDSLLRGSSRQVDSMRVASVADQTETDVIRNVLDLPTGKELDRIRNETRGDVEKLHDATYVTKAANADLKRFTDNKQVFVLSLEDAKKFTKGIDKEIPDDVKALYVPNEGFTIFIKDHIKKSSDINALLRHEVGTHANLKATIGDKRYNKLLRQVADGMDNPDTVWGKVRKLHATDEPEEILAYAVEHDMLKTNVRQSLEALIKRGFKNQGITTSYTNDDIKDFIKKSLETELEQATDIHYNADGSTIWAGVKYSKENIINPHNLAKFYTLESDVEKAVQDGWLGKNKIARWLGKKSESSKYLATATPSGVGRNSLAPTLRKVTSMLLSDARGREHNGSMVITADRMKEYLVQQQLIPFTKYINVRDAYIHRNIQEGFGRKACMEFDKEVFECFNAKYGGNKACVKTEFPKEVLEAAEHIKELREMQIELGKTSASKFGITNIKNLIDPDWNPVDPELWRIAAPEQLSKFINNCFKSCEEASAFLIKYYKASAKRDVIKEKLKRQIDAENAKLAKGEELKSNNITDKMINDYLNEHVPVAVKHMLDLDMHRLDGGSNLGELRFLKHRIPIDTTTVMKLPSGKDFSFDNNLRSFDMDYIIGRNINRLAGEIAIKNTFGSQHNLTKTLQKVRAELDKAVNDGAMDKSRADFEYSTFEDTLNELRGKRPQRDVIGQFGVFCRILQKLSYYKNGAQMMAAQFGELGGIMAYSGMRGLFYTFKPLRTWYEKAAKGELSASASRDAEYFLFGDNLERQIWTTSWGDRVTRDALTERSLGNSMLRGTADLVHNLGKITSSVNLLGHMTDSMTRGVRTGMIGDSIRWARGEAFSRTRNPFTDAKLKAANVSPRVAREIKECLNKYIQVDKKGNPIKFELDAFQKNNPNAFWKWRDMIQNQADRAIVNGTQVGNRNLMKDANPFTRLFFQYKDFTMRAVNAQTMRAMRAHDFDDFLAMGMSMVSNTAAYAAKAGVAYGAMKAMGATDKAEDFYEQNFSPEQLSKVAFLRSAMIGAPLSPLNDFYEAFTGSPTIRTTVDRNTKRKPSQDPSDITGDYLTQLPGIKTGLDHTYGVIKAFYHMATDTANKRDFKILLNALPVPNLIPWVQGVNQTVDQSKYPDKRPQNK